MNLCGSVSIPAGALHYKVFVIVNIILMANLLLQIFNKF